MTDEQIAELETAAKNSFRGPWVNTHGGCADYIISASPDFILELIADYRQTKKERNWLASAIGLGMVSSCEDKTFDEILQIARDATCQSGDTK